VAIAEKITKKL